MDLMQMDYTCNNVHNAPDLHIAIWRVAKNYPAYSATTNVVNAQLNIISTLYVRQCPFSLNRTFFSLLRKSERARERDRQTRKARQMFYKENN